MFAGRRARPTGVRGFAGLADAVPGRLCKWSNHPDHAGERRKREFEQGVAISIGEAEILSEILTRENRLQRAFGSRNIHAQAL